LFTSSGGGPLSARTITVNPTVASDPASLPTSSTPGTPGNNDLIASIASLATDGTFLDSMTPEGFYGSVITQLAQYGASANDRLSAAKTVLQQITSEHESLAGVNLDEEATNLITYQRAFEAAARVISVSSDMLSTLVNLGR
jgi:flagellar hook-associated protein 1 FlgK